MKKKIVAVILATGVIAALSITSLASFTFYHNYNGATRTETARVTVSGGTYSCRAYARVEDAANNYLGSAENKKTISSGSCEAKYKCVNVYGHHGYYELSAQNTSVSGDHGSASGRDY